jgi:hypothetical protein
MYKTVLFLIAFLICLNPKSWATPIPPGPYLNVSIVSSNESNNACVGEQIQLSPVFENPEMLEFLVGDIGPGSNGTVFFDKGNDSDGWRYLQLASFDIIIPDSINTGFGCDCENVDADNIGPGSGFDNFLEWKSSPCASDLIQYIDELNIVGFDDWYIPSKDELNLLYAFLLNQNSVFIEPFIEGYYWSSSPAAFGDCGNNGGVFQKSMILRYQCHQNYRHEILLFWFCLDQVDRTKHLHYHLILKFHIISLCLDMGYNQIFLRG